MRKSRVLLAGVAVAAAAAATTAFTGSNTLPDTVIGYGASVASGAVIDTVHYNHAADSTVVTAVVFTTDSSVGGETATVQLQLKDATTHVETNVGASYGCLISGPVSTTYTITCDTTRSTLDFADFDLTGLTVAP
jgi:hypothetical protein